MNTEHCDVLIIGGGPGGISAASKVALQGKCAIIINDGPLMGYGIEGAFKSKAGYEIAREYLHVKYRDDVFGQIPEIDFSALQMGIERSAAGLTSMLETRLQRLKVRVVQGKASFVDAHRVAVGDQEYSGDHIVIATGTRPRILPNMSVDGKRVITSDEALNLSNSPKSVLILGAGVIGCEFASMFNAVGTEVHLVDTRAQIMSNEDRDVSEFIGNAFDAMGIHVIPSSRYQSHVLQDDGVRTTLSTGDIKTEMILLSVGRIPSTDNINLAATGVALDQRDYIRIDANARTNVPHIYAVGDIGSRNVPSDLSLVHVAEAEGRCAAAHILGTEYPQGLDHIPYIVFTVPMLAGAGVTELYVREHYGDVRVGKYPYARNHRAHAIQPPIGFVKLIVGPPGDDRILGVRAVGPSADAIVGAAAIMIERKLPYDYIVESIFPHPSLLECLQGAAHIIAGDALQYEEGEELTIAQALVAKVALFADLSASQIAEVAALLSGRLAAPGEVIFREGDPVDSVYFIASGEVQGMTERQSFRLGAGDIFGEIALLREGRRTATVTASTTCRLLTLERRDFSKLLGRDEGIRTSVSRVAEERLQQLRGADPNVPQAPDDPG